MSLSGRVAFVTGASQGIGQACALELANHGAAVALAARNQEKLNQLVQQITASGGKAAAFSLDVTDEAQIKSTFKNVIAQFGKLDILVNNAGITRDQLIMRMKRADWDAVLNTNLTSAYLCTQQAIGSMLKQRWGRIINITSVFGQMGQAGQANYASSKAGLIGLTMAVAREVGIALHAAQLLEENAQRVEQQAALLNAAQVVCSELTRRMPSLMSALSMTSRIVLVMSRIWVLCSLNIVNVLRATLRVSTFVSSIIPSTR